MSNKRLLIIGGGVSGLTTALKLLELGHDVTIWQKEPLGELPHTSRNAYAMWVPVNYAPGLERWANLSLEEYTQIARNYNEGVALLPIFQLQTERSEPWFAHSFPGFRHAEPDELTSEYADAHVLEDAPVIDPAVYLPWLRARVVDAGASFEQRTLTSLEEAPAEFSVVINCAGLGARQLANDESLFAERVQVVIVKNRGQLDRVVIDDSGPNARACVVPHDGYIKLGAVFTSHSEDLQPDAAATAGIIARCNKMVPELEVTANDVIDVICACRPERSVPRVEQTNLRDGRLLVHNYGHDGMGYILAPGIAIDIASWVAAA